MECFGDILQRPSFVVDCDMCVLLYGVSRIYDNAQLITFLNTIYTLYYVMTAKHKVKLEDVQTFDAKIAFEEWKQLGNTNKQS